MKSFFSRFSRRFKRPSFSLDADETYAQAPGRSVASPAAAGYTSVPVRREIAPSAQVLEAGNVDSVIAAGVEIRGSLLLREGGVRIKCKVNGAVEQRGDSLVVVDRDALVKGIIRARYLLVLGQVQGNIYAERVIIGETAVVDGDVHYKRTMHMVSGAAVRGALKLDADLAVFASDLLASKPAMPPSAPIGASTVVALSDAELKTPGKPAGTPAYRRTTL